MVFTVRCYKCGENEVRLVLGGRAIIHARCHGCDSNLLAEIMEFEQQVTSDQYGEDADSTAAESAITPVAESSSRDEQGIHPGGR